MPPPSASPAGGITASPARAIRSDIDSGVCLGVVLSGGGLRGAAHVGVLKQLVAHDVPIDIIVGSSAGAIVAAYYAAVGLTLDELAEDARRFRGRHLIAHSLNTRFHGCLDRWLHDRSGLIPERLAALDRATFDRLHHGVRAIGIVCHDRASHRPCCFATTRTHGVKLGDVVRASASIPLLFPSMKVQADEGCRRLTDGGVSDCLPIAFATEPPLSATHVIVSDCRWIAHHPPAVDERLLYIKPRLSGTGSLWAPAATLAAAVDQGAAAVSDDVLRRAHSWLSGTD